MAKKFGKALFYAAAIGSAVGAACYFLHKRDSIKDLADEDDYDDFHDDSEESSDSSRSYVALTPESADTQNAAETPESADTQDSAETPAEETDAGTFTPLMEQAAQTLESTEENVEEFFDEDDPLTEEPPVTDD